jgi:hypothetical protein
MKPEEIKQAEDWILKELIFLKDINCPKRIYYCTHERIKIIENLLIALKQIKPEVEK